MPAMDAGLKLLVKRSALANSAAALWSAPLPSGPVESLTLLCCVAVLLRAAVCVVSQVVSVGRPPEPLFCWRGRLRFVVCRFSGRSVPRPRCRPHRPRHRSAARHVWPRRAPQRTRTQGRHRRGGGSGGRGLPRPAGSCAVQSLGRGLQHRSGRQDSAAHTGADSAADSRGDGPARNHREGTGRLRLDRRGGQQESEGGRGGSSSSRTRQHGSEAGR